MAKRSQFLPLMKCIKESTWFSYPCRKINKTLLMEFVLAERASEEVTNHSNVFILSTAVAPQSLIAHLLHRAPKVKNVKIFHLHAQGKAKREATLSRLTRGLRKHKFRK